MIPDGYPTRAEVIDDLMTDAGIDRDTATARLDLMLDNLFGGHTKKERKVLFEKAGWPCSHA